MMEVANLSNEGISTSKSFHPPRIPHEEQAISGEENAREYGRVHRRSARLAFRGLMREVRALKPRGRYLEMGCGPGLLSVMMAEDNPDVEITAVDLSPAMVEAARGYARERGVQDRVRFLQADVTDEPILSADGKYDLVFSTFSLHHWADPERAMAVLWRLLKDQGVLYIQDLKRVRPLYCLAIRNGFFDSIRASYLPSEIEAMFLGLGIDHYRIRSAFPWFMQRAVAWKEEDGQASGAEAKIDR